MSGVETKYKEDLVNNLSLELARTKNEKKFLADKLEKLDAENEEIRGQLKQLLTVKSSLEKSIIDLTQQKDQLQKDVSTAQNVVQNKVNEIFDMKKSLDQSVSAGKSGTTDGIELPPIVVNSSSQSGFSAGAQRPDFNGKIVSVNQDNNFVIVSLGQNSGLQSGDVLSVYRNSQYIARLQVIQVRKDISAADIKEQLAQIQVGDVIR